MSRLPVITGVGLVTPLGVGVAATWAALLEGRHITDTGVVPIDRDGSLSRVAQLGVAAATEALAGRRIEDAALIVGTSKGPADEWLRNPTTARGLASLADELAARLAAQRSPRLSPRLTLSAACASGLHALTRAVLLLEQGDASRVLVVASESSLHPLWHGTFKRLGVLPPPGEVCRPFDVDRKGFLISEAAAAILLEKRAPVAGELVVDRARICADTTHLTSSDPDATSLKRLLLDLRKEEPSCGVEQAIDFVHAHATATGSDAIELSAIRDALGPQRPDVYSHKGALGHTLGASGLVALVLNAQIHGTFTRPPMPTLRQAIDPYVFAERRTFPAVRTSLVLASGFGGAIAGVRLKTW